MKKDTLVYQHRRNDTGEIFYIGIGNEDRAHSKHQRSNWWNSVVNKHGYSVEILQTNLTWQEACKEEKRLIKLYGRKDLGLGTLVNMTDGGDGIKGYKHTEETIEYLKNYMTENNPFKGKKHKKEVIKIMREKKVKKYIGDGNPFFGKTHTDKSKNKISKRKKNTKMGKENHFYGKKHTNETIEKMSLLTKEDVIYIRNNFIKGVNQHNRGNLLELAEMFGVSRSCIQGIISNKNWTHI